MECEDGEVLSNEDEDKLADAEELQDDEDKIPRETLKGLDHSASLHQMLTNSHLRKLLEEIDQSPDPQRRLQVAMNIPVFVEFADECLRVCGLRNEQ